MSDVLRFLANRGDPDARRALGLDRPLDRGHLASELRHLAAQLDDDFDGRDPHGNWDPVEDVDEPPGMDW
jgi:hypothetical protein